MTVEQEANQKRRFHRVTVPLRALIQGHAYRIQDWSLGGFLIEGFAEDRPLESELEAHLVLPYEHFSVDIPVRCRLVRLTEGTAAFAFVGLAESPRKALRGLLEAAIEGRLTDLEGVLASAREPFPSTELDKVLLGETHDEAVRSRRRRLRRSAFWSVLGLAVVLGVAALVWNNLTYLEVDNGVILGSLVVADAPLNGSLQELSVAEGAAVQAGQALFRVVNKTLEDTAERAKAACRVAQVEAEALAHELEEVKARKDQARTEGMARVKAELEVLKAEDVALAGRRQEEEARIELLRAVTQRQIDQQHAALARIDALILKSAAHSARLAALRPSGAVSKEEVDEAEAATRALQAERVEVQQQLKLTELNEKATAEGRFFTGREIEGRVKELEAGRIVLRAKIAQREVELTTGDVVAPQVSAVLENRLDEVAQRLKSARARVEQTNQDLATALRQLTDGQVVSCCEGRVLAVYRRPGELVSRGDIVLKILETQGVWAVGRVPLEQAVRLRPGQAVDVVLPSLGVRLRGSVTAIGHESVDSGTRSSADLESSLKEVPFRIRLDHPPAGLPLGIRARLRIHVDSGFAAWVPWR